MQRKLSAVVHHRAGLTACDTHTPTPLPHAQHSPDGLRAGFHKALMERPDGPEATSYRLWMTSVLQPLNEKAAGGGGGLDADSCVGGKRR